MLNANARRVTDGVCERIERLVAPENIYYSHSPDESLDITAEIASQDYPTVFTGGGDGTFVKFINDYSEIGAGFNVGSAVPNIGVLHLGTGNAVASIVSSGNYECDLRSYLDSGYRDFQKLALVDAEGSKFPFGGLGWDAEILNDYMALKHGVGANRFVKPLVQNLGGYFAAFFGRTMPRQIKRIFRPGRTEVRVTNLGDEARVLYAGEAVKSYGPGEVLYEGPTNVTMFGSCPYYGHGLTVLPYSLTQPGFLHLRVVRMGMMKVLSNLRSIWKGTYVGDDSFDWHVKHVRLDFSEPVPYQYGGDAQGYRESLELKISPVCVNLLRFI
jgi:diacylglycerol kinase family enzyme